MYGLDAQVDADNAVHLIDLFVDSLNLKLKKNENPKLTVLILLLLSKLVINGMMNWKINVPISVATK